MMRKLVGGIYLALFRSCDVVCLYCLRVRRNAMLSKCTLQIYRAPVSDISFGLLLRGE
jgi:hypothetical protein